METIVSYVLIFVGVMWFANQITDAVKQRQKIKSLQARVTALEIQLVYVASGFLK